MNILTEILHPISGHSAQFSANQETSRLFLRFAYNVMPILTFCAIGILVFMGHDRLHFLIEVTQSLCVRSAQTGDYGVWRAALICGSSVNQESNFSSLKELGLIHLIVVSGAHLVFFENFLEKIFFFLDDRSRRKVISGILIVYCFFAGFQPPLVRALLQRLRFTTLTFGMFFSGVATALFFREVSLSLALSWSASLLVAWPHRSVLSPFSTSLMIALGLSPLLWTIGVPPLWAAFLQPLFSVFFGALVFPLCFISLFLPLEQVHSFIWSSFFKLVEFCGQRLDSSPFFSTSHSTAFMGFYVLTIQFVFWKEEIKVIQNRLWPEKSKEIPCE